MTLVLNAPYLETKNSVVIADLEILALDAMIMTKTQTTAKVKEDVEMADCFSLPNVAELVEMLRHGYDEEHGIECFTIHHHPTLMEKRAADAIEKLMQENAKLKERCELLQGNNVLLRGCVDKYNIEQIERLREENAKLKAERDAAVADLDMAVNGQETYPCHYCKNNREGCYCWNEDEGYANWEWCGVQEDKGNG